MKLWRVNYSKSYRRLDDHGPLFVPAQLYNPYHYSNKFESVDLISAKFVYSPAEASLPVGDFVPAIPSVLIFNEKVKNEISGLISGTGRQFKIRIEDSMFDIFFSTVELNVLCFDSSEYTLTSHKNPRFRNISKIAVDVSGTKAPAVFRLAGDPLLRLQLIVSDEFKKKCENCDLTGLDFEEVIVLDQSPAG